MPIIWKDTNTYEGKFAFIISHVLNEVLFTEEHEELTHITIKEVITCIHTFFDQV